MKPWPNQKRPPYDDQSGSDPWPAPNLSPTHLGPGLDEYRMEIEANEQMEIFWIKIFGGSVIGGACVIGGPAILPSLEWLGGGAAAAAAY